MNSTDRLAVLPKRKGTEDLIEGSKEYIDYGVKIETSGWIEGYVEGYAI